MVVVEVMCAIWRDDGGVIGLVDVCGGGEAVVTWADVTARGAFVVIEVKVSRRREVSSRHGRVVRRVLTVVIAGERRLANDITIGGWRLRVLLLVKLVSGRIDVVIVINRDGSGERR